MKSVTYFRQQKIGSLDLNVNGGLDWFEEPGFSIILAIQSKTEIKCFEITAVI
jgi:hypothetical protein